MIFMGTIWLFNIAMENGPFIDGLPIKNGDFPLLCYDFYGYLFSNIPSMDHPLVITET